MSGRRNKQNLFFFSPKLFHDVTHVINESHIEKSIGFVQRNTIDFQFRIFDASSNPSIAQVSPHRATLGQLSELGVLHLPHPRSRHFDSFLSPSFQILTQPESPALEWEPKQGSLGFVSERPEDVSPSAE